MTRAATPSDEAIEVMARAECKRRGIDPDWHVGGNTIKKDQARNDARDTLSVLTKAGYVVVPREPTLKMLCRCRDKEYNSFEPDNQSKHYTDLVAMIAAWEGQ